MRLEEIQAASQAEQRVKQMKASAKAAKERANQLKVQADASGEQLAMQKSRAKLTQLQRKAASSTINAAT